MQQLATSRRRVVSKIIHRSDILAERWSYNRQMSTSQRSLSLAVRPKRAASVGAAARRESAKTRVELGLALYQAGGIGGAVTSWQLALADDPSAGGLCSSIPRSWLL